MRWLLPVLVLSVSSVAHAEEPQGVGALLDALAQAQDSAAAAGLEQRIARLWQQSAGPMAAMLLAHAGQSMQDNDADAAAADVSAALTLAPDNLAVLHQRALVRYEQGDIAGAYRDLESVISHEPRHFAAWRSLAEIAEAQGNVKAAYAAWQKLLEIDPKIQDGSKKRDELRRKVEGEKS